MYKKAVNYWRGSVTLAVESPFPERVVNLCAAHGIPFWDLRWQSPGAFTVQTTAAGYERLRQAAETVACTVRPVRRAGLPELWRHLRRRYALLAGAAVLVLLLFGGSVFIWGFEVTGNHTVPEERILRALEEYGITVGTVSLRIDQEALRNHVLLEMPDLSWLVVNVKGCVAHVQVVERQRPPQRVEEDRAANVVAARSGLVTEIRALDGKAQVAKGATVTAGQLLISGVVDSDRSGVRLLHGMGEVWARTWYDLSVLVPLQEAQHTAVAEESTRIWLNFGKRPIKLWAKGSILGADCGKILQYGAVCLPGGFRLPLTVVKETTVRYETQSLARSESQARAEGEAALLEQLAREMTAEGSVTSTRFSAARQGTYLLVTLRAECLEQIGQQVILPQ